MTVFLLFLYFAKANQAFVPEWIMNLTWALAVGGWVIRLLSVCSKMVSKE